MEHFSVPAGDAFIYLVDFGEEILAGEQFPSPPGTFLLSISETVDVGTSLS